MEPLIRVENAIKKYPVNTGRFTFRRDFRRALDGVSIEIGKGEILGLVGESGSGKTTLGMALLGLIQIDDGSIYFEGRDVKKLRGREKLEFVTKTQMIFQDPYESLNPLRSVYDSVSSPLTVSQREMKYDERVDAVCRALKRAGLYPPESFLGKYPQQLSGGQRQRVGIARAIISNPSFVVADEPVSMLDMSVRAEILNLLADISKKDGLSMVFISHDMVVTKYISQRIAVLYMGQLVELAASSELVKNPLHPYTQILIKSVPLLESDADTFDTVVEYDSDTINRGENACAFRANCPHVMDVCRSRRPPVQEISTGHFVACFLYSDSGKVGKSQSAALLR
jgi:peptide/nickel transport system ATP-binding protein